MYMYSAHFHVHNLHTQICTCTCIVHIFMYIIYTHRYVHVLGYLRVLWCTFSNYLHVLVKLNIEIFDLWEMNQWVLCVFVNIHVVYV